MDYVEQLIDKVKASSLLYDIHHPDYKHIRKRDEKWAQIAKELEMNETDAKKKWRNLRDTYQKYLRTMKRCDGTKIMRTWQWAKNMDYFRPFFEATQNFVHKGETITYANIENIKIELDENDHHHHQEEQHQNEIDNYLIEQSSNGQNANNSVDDESITTSFPYVWKDLDEHQQQQLPSHSPSRTITAKRKRGDTADADVADKILHYLDRKQKHLEAYRLDAVEHIFLGLAKTVKTFSQRRQTEVKLKITQIVMENEFEHLNELEDEDLDRN